jgi:peptide/nickel transport system permease protein
MSRYVVSRLLQMIPVVFVVTFLVFSITLLLPGDPTIAMLGEQSSAADRAALGHEMGLDLPIPMQYARWIGNLTRGRLGTSLRSHEPVGDMLLHRAPLTIELSLLSVAFAALIGIPAGVLAALRRNSWVDVVASVAAMFSMAVPFFWAGILMISFFSITLGWLPSSGYVPLSQDPLQNIRLMILPTITLGGSLAALIMRQTRTSMLEVLGADFVRTARAKGAREPRVVLRHALHNALLPVVTVLGLQIGTLLGGAVITETVFSMSGVGRTLVDGIFTRDFPAVQGAILFLVFGVLIVNLLTDLSYFLLDKRIAR